MISIEVTLDDGVDPNNFLNYMYPIRANTTISNIYIVDSVAYIEYEDDGFTDVINDWISNFNGKMPVAVLTREALSNITSTYQQMAVDFAAHNSVKMEELGYTLDQKRAFVRKAVDAFLPIKQEMDMYSYYDLWDMFDAIERDEILTDDRINAMKEELQIAIFGKVLDL